MENIPKDMLYPTPKAWEDLDDFKRHRPDAKNSVLLMRYKKSFICQWHELTDDGIFIPHGPLLFSKKSLDIL